MKDLEQAEHFFEWVNDTYGCPEALAQHFDATLEMLFYLEPHTFDPHEVREVVAALRGVVKVLRG
ncbi:hypothetical protein [Flagellimonas allohymeniacidonis]|uniref:Uncharacterized protein n=1 Tax=Flagellimonas allohymeniacidonis TaxID=2517819 RepID=A0A4Q8QGE1_9FLAO|nr:hypothetical protein [Allomuricauda hymeniacidonis]TAI49632.1 hypothetical protein EW142_07495 [Allomuricauda hymeniacidonis]